MKKLFATLVLCGCFLAAAVDYVKAQSLTYWAIDNSGNITVTAAGATALNALTTSTTYTLTVTATNPGGTGTGTVTIVVTVPPPAAPVVNPATFGLASPVTSGQSVGTVTATGAPTSWAITGSSP